MKPMRKTIKDWLFAAGESAECLNDAVPVRLPHTWSVDEALQHHVGKGWYRIVLPAGSLMPTGRAFLYFHGAYRDTEVSVNGQQVGKHNGSGYTPFTVEITNALCEDSDTIVTVCVDNRFSTEAVPYDRSFDWANDGGLHRPVELWQTGAAVLRSCQIEAAPVILPTGKRQKNGQAVFGFTAKLDGSEAGGSVRWELHRGAEDSITPMDNEPLLSGSLPSRTDVRLEPMQLPEAAYWHFDRPELYTLVLRVAGKDGTVSDERTWTFGFRELKLQGSQWLFNGEAVRLPGMEWMPGSDPASGAAETRETMEKMLSLVKESNSVLTRFHWQQDNWVFDWCDRHGLLVQEEVPFWGKQPEGDPDKLWPVIESQLEEMIAAHRHHPSIVSWGVGNELSAHTWPVQRYIRRATACAHRLDSSRFANYVTNTAWRCKRQDGAGDGDILMINDYIGTWEPNLEQDASWRELLDAHPGRAFLPSEFGLCEPAFTGGDAARERIFLEKTAYYRQIPEIVGTIYFCLNDYRTHTGEEGEGRLRRRVHGSVSLTGEPKPSWFTVQREHAPLTAEQRENGLLLTCRRDIPCYTVSGYLLTDGKNSTAVPDLLPGESWLYSGHTTEGEMRILRPNGDLVMKIR
ncbi:MAG: hypothetical protein IJ157_14970 [Clostridia bacterium]|nr:hypothetical protein [Clostridia bacterium]